MKRIHNIYLRFDDSPPAANTTITSVVLPVTSTQTSNTASSTGTSRGPQPLVAAVAAGSISTVAIVAALLIAILWVKRRRRQAARSEDLERSRPDMNISIVQPLARELPVSSSTPIPEEPVLPPYAPVDPHANPSAVMESFSVPTSTKGIKKIADRP
jgi:hypothetical protein